jgi:hypothetical protein
MFKSTQTTVRYGEDACRYKTVIEESCTIDPKTGEQKCQRLKRVFKKCPGDVNEVEVESDRTAEGGRSIIVHTDPYEGRAKDV